MVALRFFYIQSILIRYQLWGLLWAPICERFFVFRALKLFFPWRWFKNPYPSDAQIQEALVKLGPIFIKFGQSLATRRDILPDSLADELCKLQDRVPCFSSSIAIEILEKTFKKPLHEIFKSFNPHPLAGASIAQVYSAQLNTGEQVVIKLLRPGIHKTIQKDLRLLFFVAKLIQIIPRYKRCKPIEIVKEFEKTLELELNFMNEAANASLLKRHFLNSPLLALPKIYWDYARPHVLVMERVWGIPISDINALKAANINLKKLAERGVEIFFTQVFRDGFFHADMHPGNIFVCPNTPQDPQYIAVDFGIMGTLSSDNQNYLAQNFLAFFKRDYRKIATLYVESGWVSAETSLIDFETAIRTVCEPIFERPLKEISFAASLLSLFQTAERFNMQVQPQLLLLQKTLVNIEGLGKQLYPELNLWETAQPFLEKWLKTRMGPALRFKYLLEKIQKQTPKWLEEILESI